MPNPRLALITGGSRGLGAALCAHYAAQGWRVLEFSRSAGTAHSVKTDFADPVAAGAAIDAALAPLAAGGFDEILAIANAARIGPVGLAGGLEPAAVAEHFAVNLASAAVFAGRVLRHFQSHACPKTLVNISSGAAIRPIRGWSLYGASKAGMEHFVRMLDDEQAAQPHPFSVISVSPGVMDTQMQAEIRDSRVEDFPDLDYFVGLQRGGNLRKPVDVAARVARIVAARVPGGGRYDVADYG